MKSRKSLYIIIFGLIISILIIGFGYGYDRYNYLIKADVVSGEQVKEIEIEPGDSVFVIANKLSDQSLISSNLAFYWKLATEGNWGLLQPGTYLISNDKNLDDIISILRSGTSEQEKIIIREGLSIRDIDSYLTELGLITKGDFIKLDKPKQYQAKYQFINSDVRSLEGYLFPDTYYVLSEDFEPEQLISKMLDTFDNKIFNQLSQENLPEQIDSFNQLVILASLVEKEANTYLDKRLVAGVFLNRLEQDMLLQACSTVNYLLDEPKEILSLKDISIDSEYNSYKYKGLPPTPIANPSLESIKASFDSKKSNYLYFLSDNKGEIYYAKDSAGHLQNKDNYLRPSFD